MLGIMLPVTAPCLIASVDSAPLDIGFVDAPPLDVVYVVHINVVIIVSAETVAVIGGDSVVIVVVVDVHVAVTPSTVVPPTPSPSGSQGNSDPERESAPGNEHKPPAGWLVGSQSPADRCQGPAFERSAGSRFLDSPNPVPSAACAGPHSSHLPVGPEMRFRDPSSIGYSPPDG